MAAAILRASAAATVVAALVLPGASVFAAAAPPPVVCPGGVCAVGVPAQGVQRPAPSPSPSPTPVVPPGPPAPQPLPVTPQDNLQAVGRWVMGGGSWSVCQLASQLGLPVDRRTCPDQPLSVASAAPADWFAPVYRRMIEVAGLLLLPMLLLAFLQALLRQDTGMALRAAFGHVPLAVILSSIAVTLTQSLLAVTDSFSALMLRGYEGQVAATIGGLAGVMAAGAAGSAFTVGTSAAAVIAALVALVAALAIVVELLARQAVIYAGVLFMPLAFAAMVWPRLWGWSLRLVEVVVIAVAAKFLVVSVLVLGAAAFTSGPGGPFDSQAPPGATLLIGLLLVGLAALSPMALFWMLPTLEAAAIAQFHAAARAPMAAGSGAVERGVYHLGMRRIWQQRGRPAGGGNAPGTVMLLRPGTRVVVRRPRPVRRSRTNEARSA